MESTLSSSSNDDDQAARALQRAKDDLADQVERAVAAHEPPGNDPIEVNLNFDEEDLPEGGSNEADRALMDQIDTLVEDFHNSPSVSGKGVRVQRLTAIDSDADGDVAVRIDYDHAGYE